MTRLFAYGTLLDDAVREALLGRPLSGSPDRLDGYAATTVRIDGATYPNIASTGRAGDAVTGWVFAVEKDDLRALDAYETAAYQRRKVVLASGSSAWVYLAG